MTGKSIRKFILANKILPKLCTFCGLRVTNACDRCETPSNLLATKRYQASHHTNSIRNAIIIQIQKCFTI